MFKPISKVFEGNKQKFEYNANKRTSKSKKNTALAQEVFDFFKLIASWKEIVGPNVSNNTIPLKIQNRCLYILTNHSAYSSTLSFMEPALIKNVSEKFPTLKNKLDKIYFQVNSAHFDKQKYIMAKRLKEQSHTKTENITKNAKLNKFSPLYKKLKREAEKAFNDIDDQEVKEIFISLYIQANN